MPKEVIYHPESHDALLPGDETEMVYTTNSLAVCWGKSFEGERLVPGNVALLLSEYPKVSKEEFKDAKSWPPQPSNELFTAALDREQINTLIRVLRRARDQAYGRDE